MPPKSNAVSDSKVVIIGSGFHREVLGDVAHPLCDWSQLLAALACRTGCELTQEDFSEPTQAWEKLVSRLAARKKLGIRAKDAEEGLKRELCTLLKESVNGSRSVYEFHPLLKQISSFLDRGGGHLVSLNFDQLAYAKDGAGSWSLPSHLGKAKQRRFGRKADNDSLYRRVKVPTSGTAASMVWHPHGCIKSPQSLRLGYRDYGFLPASYHHAFTQFKSWERNVIGGRMPSGRRGRTEAYRRILKALADLDRNPKGRIDSAADTWVTRFMLLPVEVIGAEISFHEVGLRWLFVQRHRNLQQYAPDSVPVIRRKAASCQLPWKSRLQEHSSWDQAWSAALAQV